MSVSNLPVFLAIDGGTESVRAALITASGAVMSLASRPYPTDFPAGGYATQNPVHWQESLVRAVRECFASAGVNGSAVSALCTDATMCTLLPLDGNGKPLSDALMWMDVRASSQAARIHRVEHAALSYCPGGVAAEWMLPKALWMKECVPDMYSQTEFFIEYQDWLCHFFTGEISLNLNTITQRWLYNGRTWRWPTDLFAKVGLPDLIDKIPPRITAPGELVGEVSVQASDLTGIPVGTPVIQGGGDAPIGMIGLNATQPGDVGLITGSSNVVAGFTEEHLSGPGIFGTFPDAVLPGLELIEAGQVSTGSILSWFRKLTCGDLPIDDAYLLLEREASLHNPGSGGVISLDSFQGNRTPFTESSFRGAMWGLSLGTTRGQMFRSLMESITFGTALILETFGKTGYQVDSVSACGGGTKSSMLMQMYADVCGIPIRTVEVQDAPLIGCAGLAAYGTGVYRSIQESAAAMVRYGETFEPRADRHEEYQRYYEFYVQTYGALSGLMRSIQDLPEIGIT